jgi:hypothetical protein
VRSGMTSSAARCPTPRAVRRAVISPAEQSSRLYVYASPRSG